MTDRAEFLRNPPSQRPESESELERVTRQRDELWAMLQRTKILVRRGAINALLKEIEEVLARVEADE